MFIRASGVLFTSVFFFFFLGGWVLSEPVNSNASLKILFLILIAACFFLSILSSGVDALKYFLLLCFSSIPFLLFFRNTYAVHLMVSAIMFCIWYMINSVDYEKSRRILLIAWWGGAVSCVSVISSMYFGLIENEEYYVATSGVIKNSLGFFNPNSVGLLSLSVFIIAMLAKSRLAVFSSALLFLFVAVNAMPRASLGLLLVFLLIILFCKTSDISVKRVALLIVWTFSFICISFFVFYDLWGLETNSAFFLMVDKFLSYRVSIAVHSESFTMANIFLPSPDFINFDLAFVTIVYNFGALLSYLFLFVLLLVIFCARRGDVDILLVSLTLMFSSLFVENIMYAYFALGVIGAAPLAMSLMYVLRSISPKNSPH